MWKRIVKSVKEIRKTAFLKNRILLIKQTTLGFP